jgi:hypothetical protein
MGRKIRLTESELVDLLEKIVKEAKKEERVKKINESRKERILNRRRIR